MSVHTLGRSNSQLIYLTNREIFSNAWAGTFHTVHRNPEAILFSMRDTSQFLILDNEQIHCYDGGKKSWSKKFGSPEPIEILYNESVLKT
jgi:hypothetical protein